MRTLIRLIQPKPAKQEAADKEVQPQSSPDKEEEGKDARVEGSPEGEDQPQEEEQVCCSPCAVVAKVVLRIIMLYPLYQAPWWSSPVCFFIITHSGLLF